MQNQETEVEVEATEESTESTESTEAVEAVEAAEAAEVQEVQPPTQPTLRSDEVIDIEWEQVEQLYRVNTYSKQLESQLAEMCLRHEKTKQNLLSRISECETFLFNSGTTLKDSCNIDPSLTYELKLPNQEGEKAFFLRKDTNQ